jgi:hypothetical protein
MVDTSQCALKFNIYKYLREHEGSSIAAIKSAFVGSADEDEVVSVLQTMTRDGIIQLTGGMYYPTITTQTCYSPTRLYTCGCQLLSHMDHDFDGVIGFENMCSTDTYFTNGDITLDEYLFVLDVYAFYTGEIEHRCPHGFALSPVHPNHKTEVEVMVNCYAPTEHYESLCHLLHAFDANHDGIITLDDVNDADVAYQNGELSEDEYFMVSFCYQRWYSPTLGGGVIRAICPDCAYVYDDIVVREPDVPDEPDIPDEPDEPDIPDEPDEPDIPDEPSTPMGDGMKWMKFLIGAGIGVMGMVYISDRMR